MDLTPYTNDKAIRRKFLSKIQFCEHGKRCKQCCWLWKGGKRDDGYGKFYVARISLHPRKELFVRSHRFMWALRYGHTELSILHTCDIPSCCNYNHLFSGTQADNMSDKQQKGRALKGEYSPTAKLTLDDIYYVFYLHGKGYSQVAIAAVLEVSKESISGILRGRSWQSATGIEKGETRKYTKLTEQDIPRIFTLKEQGYSQKEIAAVFHVHQSTISLVLSGKSQKHSKG